MLPESRRAAGPAGANKLTWSLNQPRVRSIAYQVLLVAAVGLVGWFFVSNAMENLMARRIASGFGFLSREAGFEIGETTLLSYNAGDTYLRALAVGLLNTFRVATLAIVLSTMLGALIGLARLSLNWLLAKLAAGYIEVIRNVPLVVQLFFWYAVITESFPAPANAREPFAGAISKQPGFRISDSPFRGTDRRWTTRSSAVLISLAAACYRPNSQRSLLASRFTRRPSSQKSSAPEYLQWTAANSRRRIRSVSNQRQVMRFVILPQALRVIVPPVTSQYLNCTKNSSLAVAIGYPDLVSIANTTINQTGEAIEGIAIIMLVYLTISLAISGLMNWYNRRFALRGEASYEPRHRPSDAAYCIAGIQWLQHPAFFHLVQFSCVAGNSLSRLDANPAADRLGVCSRGLVSGERKSLS